MPSIKDCLQYSLILVMTGMLISTTKAFVRPSLTGGPLRQRHCCWTRIHQRSGGSNTATSHMFSTNTNVDIASTEKEKNPLDKNAVFRVVTKRQGFSDFRSDTVTKPTQQMRKAMAKAEVGDDVFREDPTVDELEREVASMLGHESALFVPSRTMGNLISIMIWCSSRGSSFICGEKSHIFLCEEGGAAQFGGVSPFPVPNEADGSLALENIQQAILEEKDASMAQLITLESPVDRCGGRVLPVAYIEEVSKLAQEHNLKLHLDGSRIWNAAVAAGVDVKEIAQHADSVTVCLSKGLGAPAGSLLVGSRAFTEKARKLRKALGGAMRQVGVLAAAGLVALKRSLPLLSEDHENAKKLAVGLAVVPGLKVNVAGVETNIVMVDVDERVELTAAEVAEALEQRGILVLVVGPRRIRMVTHYDVSEGDVKKAINAMDKILQPYRELLSPLADSEAVLEGGETAAGESSAASLAVAEGVPTVVDTTATTVPTHAAGNRTATLADSSEVVEDTVGLGVYGVSTSEGGFVVLLAEDVESEAKEERGRRVLKVVVTPSDPMSAGLDVHQAETPEALTLLQLLQDIDVGSYFPHDALASLAGVRAGQPINLRRVVVEQLSTDNKRFKARLYVGVGDVNATSHHSLRNETMSGVASAAPEHIVETEVKSPFQAMALAFRYGAELAAVASVLEDASVSIDVSELRSAFPGMLELNGKMTSSATSVGLDLDVEYEIGRLEKQLQTALEEGNQQAVAKIKRQLALYAPDDMLAVPLLQQQASSSPSPDLYDNKAPSNKPQSQEEEGTSSSSPPQQVSAPPKIPPPPLDLIDST